MIVYEMLRELLHDAWSGEPDAIWVLVLMGVFVFLIVAPFV